MALPPRQPAELTDAVVQRLADIVGIAADRRASFGSRLRGLFHLAHHHHTRDVSSAAKRPKIESQLTQLQEAVAVVIERLSALDDDALKALGIYALRQKRFGSAVSDEERQFQIANLLGGGEAADGRLIVGYFGKVMQELHTAVGTRKWPKGPKGGRPSEQLDIPGNPKVSAFDLFSVGLSQLVHLHGGSLTLHKSLGGPAIDFLALAAEYLPHGLIPPGVLAADANGRMKGLSRLRTMIATGEKTLIRQGKEPTPK